MDKDRIVGSGKQIKGAVKEVVGKAVGDVKLESEGRADKIVGKVQHASAASKTRSKGNSRAATVAEHRLCQAKELTSWRRRRILARIHASV